MVIGNRKYLTLAVFDIVSQYSIISKRDLISELVQQGFEERVVNLFLEELGVCTQVNLADLTLLDYEKKVGIKPISITYPAYDNRGIPTKFQFDNVSSTILEDLFEMIDSATEKIIILSPYLEEDGLEYFGDLLKRKLKKNVEVKIIVRELKSTSLRISKLLPWLSENVSQYPNFALYDYHYISPNGHIDSTCHGKAVAVDSKIAYVGSADIRERAFKSNFELGIIQTGYVARAISSLLEEIVQVSDRYTMWKI